MHPDQMPGDLSLLSDEALMLAYGKGHFAAFETLYARHKNTVYRTLLRQVQHSGIAEELQQEIWLKVIHAAADYEVSARFTTWLYRIVQNRVIDHLRTAAYRNERSFGSEDEEAYLADTQASEAPLPEDWLSDAQDGARLVCAIEALPGPQREAILLHFEAGMTLEQIADVTESSYETVKSRVRYALRKLRETLLPTQAVVTP